MFRNVEDMPKTRMPVNCLLADNGIGDHIGALVAIDYIIRNCPWINLLVWVPDYLEEWAKHVLPSGSIVRNYTKAYKKYDNTKTGITTGWNSGHTPMRTHGVKYAFHMLVDYSPKPEEMNYLQINPDKIKLDKFNLPEKYIAFQATATEHVKRMPGKLANQLVDYIKSKGYDVVFIGGSSKVGTKNMIITSQKPDELDLSKGLNLVNKTSLLECGGVIARSQGFLGMDGGLLHLAGSTRVKIVAGYTFIEPELNLPVRDNGIGKDCYTIVPDESLKCRFCQSNLVMYYNHDFRSCIYKDYQCLNHMTFEKFKIEINKII